MAYQINDEWSGSFKVTGLGSYLYTVRAWVDPFGTWQSDLRKKREAGQNVAVELTIGAALLRQTAQVAEPADAGKLAEWALSSNRPASSNHAVEIALSDELTEIMRKYPDKSLATTYHKELTRPGGPAQGGLQHVVRVVSPLVGPARRARHFPGLRAFAAGHRRHGLRRAVPASHSSHRPNPSQRQNNSTTVTPNDPGSPWAIGSALGGHKAIHPQLGSFDDFQHLVKKAAEHGLEIALDLAFQCSPDHPYVAQHPEWFRWRPDGTVQFAENPPKKYEDILPLNFENDRWRELWEELKSIVLFWIDQGIRIFRVDNPHTKPLGFWQWLIGRIRREHPDVIFLSEAFTRPKVMQYLAKVGFNQSYTYFTWRNTKWELEQYIRELTQTEVGRVPAAELLAEHARYPAAVPPVRRPARVHHPPDPGGHPLRQLRHLRTRV